MDGSSEWEPAGVLLISLIGDAFARTGTVVYEMMNGVALQDADDTINLCADEQPLCRRHGTVRSLLEDAVWSRVASDLLHLCERDSQGLSDVANDGLALVLALLGCRTGVAATSAVRALHCIVTSEAAPTDLLISMRFVPALEALEFDDSYDLTKVSEVLEALRGPEPQPLGLADRLDLDVWRHIWSFSSRWFRYDTISAVCQQWRRHSLREPELWQRIIVVQNKVLADDFSETPCNDFAADAAELCSAIVDDGGVSPLSLYAQADYLPLLPSQLRRIPDASCVQMLAVAEPQFPTRDRTLRNRAKNQEEHFAMYWPLLQAVCSMTFSQLTALRLGIDGLETDDHTGALAIRRKRSVEATLFPWLAALPSTLRYLAFDSNYIGQLDDFEEWLRLRDPPCHGLDWLPPNVRGVRYPWCRRLAEPFEARLAQIRARNEWATAQGTQGSTVQGGSAQRAAATGSPPRSPLSLFDPTDLDSTDPLTAAQFLALAAALDQPTALSWYASDPSVEDLLAVATGLPPTVRYLACDWNDLMFDLTLEEWAVLAKATSLRRLCITVDETVIGSGPGPRRVTAHLASLMPAATVLVHSRSDILDDPEVDEREPRPAHRDHCQPSLLHDVFLPGVAAGWMNDPCRRVPCSRG